MRRDRRNRRHGQGWWDHYQLITGRKKLPGIWLSVVPEVKGFKEKLRAELEGVRKIRSALESMDPV